MIILNIVRIFSGIVFLSLMFNNPASAQALTGQEIKKLISGYTVKLSTPFGVSLPLFYSENGVVTGDVSGISAASLFAPKEQGKWWIQDNSMCQQWPSWYKRRRFCFQITVIGDNKIQWLRDDGASGTAIIVR